MNAAVNAIVGLVLIAFGSWRILAGLYVLDMVEWRVPGHDIPDRFVPRLMKGDEDIGGLLDILLGLVVAVVGVLALVGAF